MHGVPRVAGQDHRRRVSLHMRTELLQELALECRLATVSEVQPLAGGLAQAAVSLDNEGHHTA